MSFIHYAVIKLVVSILSIVILSAITLKVSKMSVIKLRAVMPSVNVSFFLMSAC